MIEEPGARQDIPLPRNAPVLGLIINPIAGMGGLVALHGTDGSAWRDAVGLGAQPIATRRAGRALDQLARAGVDVRVLAAPGVMGAEAARAHGLSPRITSAPVGEETTAADTRASAQEMLDRGVALLLFAGGDGTACDIVSVVGTRVPILGIPAGVKMHSGVFGVTPEAAGSTAAGFLARPGGAELAEVEVLDVAADRPLDNDMGASVMAVARVPYVPGLVQRAKASAPVHDVHALEALCGRIADEMVPDRSYIIGPGTTTARILLALGLRGTLAGVDVVRNGQMVLRDATEAELLELLADGRPATVVLGVIGGQGFLLGRGNQQISPRVLAAIDERDIVIVASADKIQNLDPPVLRVDFGDEPGQSMVSGYRRVRTGPSATTILKVVG